MVAWALGTVLLLTAGLEADLQVALRESGVPHSGLGLAAGRVGEAPAVVVHPDTPRAPASNQKLLTAFAAVRRLGADFHFTTEVAEAEGGHLVVVGDGDPNLSGRFFRDDPDRVLRELARDVLARGVQRVEGSLVLDASRFDRVFVHPDWPRDQLERWYCAPVAALVYNDSCWDLTVRPGATVGAASIVEVEPALLSPALLNECVTIDTGKQVVHLGRGAGSGLQVRGRIRRDSAGIAGHVAVRDPITFFGQAFLAALREEGIEIAGGLAAGSPKPTRSLVKYRTSLARTLQVTLTQSQNLYAECVFKRLGGGSFESAGEAVLETLGKARIGTKGLVIRDGSGLASTNRVTARALYDVLQSMRDERVFVDALAAGGEGTLRRRYRGLGPRLRAKTGHIRGVSALSGYVEGREGGRYVFVILANGRSVTKARALQDRVVSALARRP